jgi:hypothetical protein
MATNPSARTERSPASRLPHSIPNATSLSVREVRKLRKYRRAFSTPREGVAKDGAIRYRAAQHDCDACMLKPKRCPNRLARKIARSVHEAARDKARAIAKTEAYAVSCRERTIASTNEGWDRSRRDIGESPSEVKPRESNPPHSCKDL